VEYLLSQNEGWVYRIDPTDLPKIMSRSGTAWSYHAIYMDDAGLVTDTMFKIKSMPLGKYLDHVFEYAADLRVSPVPIGKDGIEWLLDGHFLPSVLHGH
jgi:hypothetical protein